VSRETGGQGASSGGGSGASRGRGPGANVAGESNTSVAPASQTLGGQRGIRGGWSFRPNASGGLGAGGSAEQGTSGAYPSASAGAGPSISGGGRVEVSGDIGGPRSDTSQCEVCVKGDLSGTTLMRYGRCRAVIYCSTKCQHADFKEYQKICPR
jgi:MYND finger